MRDHRGRVPEIRRAGVLFPDLPDNFQLGAGAAAVRVHGIFPGHAVFVGGAQHDVDVCHPDFLSGDHSAGGIQVRFAGQPDLSFLEEYQAVHFEWDISRAGGICAVPAHCTGGVAHRRAGIPQSAGPLCAVSVRCPMSKTMIEVSDVTMRFRMNNDKILSLKEFVTTALRGKLNYREFTALDHVSFTVKKGETLGLIGRNGAGKSTMLKVISGILKPTEGSVTCHGNVVPMLELGSGFDMDLTGRENIFLNGAILGYSEEFLKEKYEEIVEFSELGQFIEVPIRNYSSGMLARLAFSIATVVQPEILIVDEILSVGDAQFQEKSKKRMLELMGGGTTVLFVSHSIEQIREMCSRVAWLEKGQVKLVGQAKEICSAYENGN